QQRSVLEGRIEQLKTFEREYRVRLKSYLESQLEELEQRGSAVPVDGGQEAFGSEASKPGLSQTFAKGNN
ncbi:cell wall synthesis protein, partial [Rhodococcus sp. NPDC058514]